MINATNSPLERWVRDRVDPPKIGAWRQLAPRLAAVMSEAALSKHRQFSFFIFFKFINLFMDGAKVYRKI